MNSKPIKKAISTDLAPAPVGPYNQAIIADNWIYCSGQIALDPKTNVMASKDIESETNQVLSNLLAVLDSAGASANDVIRTTIYLVDLKDFDTVNKIYEGKFSKGISPSRACVEVSALPKGARVEIDCVAWLGSKAKKLHN